MTFRQYPVLALSQKSGYGCYEIDNPPVVETTCRYRDAEQRYVCDEDIERRRLVPSVDEFKTNHWEYSANNIRWTMDHADYLREHGYVIPPEVLEALPRHLE